MADYLIETFHNAKEYGSILTVEPNHYDELLGFIERVKQEEGNLLFRAWIDEIEKRIVPLIEQAKILSAKYDVVVTNPPYMGSSNMSAKLSAFVKKNYADTKSDLSTVCMEKTISMCKNNGYMAMINIPVWMFISSYEKLRMSILENNTYSSMLHLGRGIFGSDFGTTSFVIFKQHMDNYKGIYRRLFEKQGAVDSIEEKEQKFLVGQGTFVATQENFAKIPGAPVAYWVSEKFNDMFNEMILSDVAYSFQGMITGDNNYYLRLWFEVSRRKFFQQSRKDFNETNVWVPYNKGGEYRKWFGNNEYVLRWVDNGKKLTRARTENKDYYFREGITWSFLTSSFFSCRYFPNGFLWDVAGSSIFAIKDVSLYCIAGLMNSIVAQTIFNTTNPTLNYQVENIIALPYKHNVPHKIVDKLVAENISLSKADWDSFETSWDFERHPLV